MRSGTAISPETLLQGLNCNIPPRTNYRKLTLRKKRLFVKTALEMSLYLNPRLFEELIGYLRFFNVEHVPPSLIHAHYATYGIEGINRGFSLYRLTKDRGLKLTMEMPENILARLADEDKLGDFWRAVGPPGCWSFYLASGLSPRLSESPYRFFLCAYVLSSRILSIPEITKKCLVGFIDLTFYVTKDANDVAEIISLCPFFLHESLRAFKRGDKIFLRWIPADPRGLAALPLKFLLPFFPYIGEDAYFGLPYLRDGSYITLDFIDWVTSGIMYFFMFDSFFRARLLEENVDIGFLCSLIERLGKDRTLSSIFLHDERMFVFLDGELSCVRRMPADASTLVGNVSTILEDNLGLLRFRLLMNSTLAYSQENVYQKRA